MPLALPWIIGAMGIGAVGGAWIASDTGKLLKWAAIAGAVYLVWEHNK